MGQKLAEVARLNVEGLGQLDDGVLVDRLAIDVVRGTVASDLAFNNNQAFLDNRPLESRGS